jgi:hypothetical protein
MGKLTPPPPTFHHEAEMAKKASPKQDPNKEAAEAQASGQEGHGVVSKADAIRRMLTEGIENPSVASAEIKKRFGLEVTPQHFSASRAQMKSREGAKQGRPAKRGRKPKEAPSQAVEGYLAPPPKNDAVDGRRELLAAMEAMKPLIASLGKEEAHRIVDLLG